MKKILFQESLSVRKQPKNLTDKDLRLFSHEFEKKIPESYIFFEKKIYSFNSIIFSLRKFKNFKKYSFFGDKTFIERTKIIIKNYLLSTKKVKTIEKGTWFTDNKSHVYFHWILDALERSELAIDYLDEYPLLVPEEFFKKDFIAESLDFLGLNYLILKNNHVYKINELLITSKTAETGNYNEKILKNLINRFKFNANKPIVKTYKNIFIYRDSKIGRNIQNFEEIKHILEKHKYEVINFEDYSYDEKIAILKYCENLLGMFGSGLSNMIFLDEARNLIEIRNLNDYKNNAFYSLSSACDLNYYYLFFELKDDGCYVDPMILDNLLNKL